MSGRSKKVLLSLAAHVVVDGERVRLARGDAIPAGIGSDDRALLESRGAIGTQAALRKDEAARTAAAEGKTATAPVDDSTVQPEVQVDAFAPKTATDEQLIEWFKTDGPTIDAVVHAAGADAELVSRLLEAESAATNGNPRPEVVEGLTAIVEGQSSGGEPE